MFQTLEEGPGEYSYPSIAQSRSGDLIVTYTWNRKLIRFKEIPSATSNEVIF